MYNFSLFSYFLSIFLIIERKVFNKLFIYDFMDNSRKHNNNINIVNII